MRTISYLITTALLIFVYSISFIEINTHIGTLFIVLSILFTIVVLSYLYNIKSLRKKNISLTDELYKLDDKYIRLYNSEIHMEHKYLNEISILQNELDVYKDNDIPFNEPIKQCPNCGNDMRGTAKMWICDNCKKRMKKQ